MFHQITNVYKRKNIIDKYFDIIHTKIEVFLIDENHRVDVEKHLPENNKYDQQQYPLNQQSLNFQVEVKTQKVPRVNMALEN
jgi:hypothetical protein